ncbi:FtsW/RodA/SpoVE family cell cycle protein [Planococcus lenghuensis]|uniref:Probable peptidoglycan glycosyltransferase FtsW n=1 Tax=Planococcus lenghuensis TaxID=2213202 RepID=A0A1Q2L1S2_9BACL|nr:FtsW/RodA/SpoVE family cell cycle protein [Planococcus lenghuensis]AQQ53832.1 cell division protein FtsW [Planococcus lenghuensis]
MKAYIEKYRRYFDFHLFFTYIALSIFGLIMIYSASIAWAYNVLDQSPNHYFIRQLFNLAISLPVLAVAALFPYKYFRNRRVLTAILAVMFLGLILVHFIGEANGGAQSWISIMGLVNMQPSEVAKIGIILYLAGAFANKYDNGTINQLNQGIIPPVVVMTFAIFLVFLEPDLGTATLIGMIGLCVMAASGIRFNVFMRLSSIVVGAVAIFIIPFMIFAGDQIFTEKRLGRVDAFFNPFSDELGYGFQIVNGYLAIGSGGLSGLGLGQSIQKLGYLPEPHTDFIMAVIAEELGVLGVAFVIGGLAFIVLKALSIAMTTKDPLARMLAAGVGSMIGIQSFVNLGGLTGIIPLTGVPLPFISYGGTSIVLLSLAMGILLNVSTVHKYEKLNE